MAQVRNIVNVAVKLQNTAQRTSLVKQEPKHRVEKSHATGGALSREQRMSQIVLVLEAVGTILACGQLPLARPPADMPSDAYRT